jgi:uncharacterized membrane protein (UPF0127 family)
VVKIKAKNTSTFFSKFQGLMFKNNIEPIFLKTRFGIHTFFVKAPIIVLVLDNQNIVQQKKIIKPWKVFFWNPIYNRILELPINDKKVRKTKVGDEIKY